MYREANVRTKRKKRTQQARTEKSKSGRGNGCACKLAINAQLRVILQLRITLAILSKIGCPIPCNWPWVFSGDSNKLIVFFGVTVLCSWSAPAQRSRDTLLGLHKMEGDAQFDTWLLGLQIRFTAVLCLLRFQEPSRSSDNAQRSRTLLTYVFVLPPPTPHPQSPNVLFRGLVTIFYWSFPLVAVLLWEMSLKVIYKLRNKN